MRKRVIFLLFVLFVFLNLLGDGPPSFTIHEVDIVLANSDTLHCYIRTYPSYWNSPEANRLKPIITGVDIKSMLIPIHEIVYIDDYYHDPEFGFLVDNNDFHYLTINNSTVSNVFYKGKVQGFSEMFITTVSANCISNLKTSRVVSRIDLLDDSQGTSYINFDPEVSSEEFVVLFQTCIQNYSCLSGPVLSNPFEDDVRGRWNLDLYLSYNPTLMPYNEKDISKKINTFIKLKKNALNQIMKIIPKHEILFEEIIKFQTSFIKNVEFLYDWYLIEINKDGNPNRLRLLRSLENDFNTFIEKMDKKWQKIIESNENEISKITYNCIYSMWD
ncbi:MAG: hypothetical protein Q7J16_09750 [Candidatus Cloacimonadales bacterium]|nr:hypothetical protein [Candidatus Cloacimonadales bacterium]